MVKKAWVMDYIERVLEHNPMHMTLLDHGSYTKKNISKLTQLVGMAKDEKTGAFMVGGSTQGELTLDNAVIAIREELGNINLPIIHFPVSADELSPKVDAIYFMSLLNSQDRNFIVGHQKRAAPLLKKAGIECINMGYLIAKPGMEAGEVGRVGDLIIKLDSKGIKEAKEYAHLVSQWGFPLLYLERGSGSPNPLSDAKNLLLGVRNVLDQYEIKPRLIGGGGLKTAKKAKDAIEYGLEIVVTGDIGEKRPKKLPEIINAVQVPYHEFDLKYTRS